MIEKVYKYFSKEVLNLVFARKGFCGIKCSLPRDYNDPFELFLGVDLSVPTELLATYREIVSQVPQIPTTCFSRSPVVSPMWAHYAHNHSGFVLEFDVVCLKGTFEGAGLRDVDYKDTPDSRIGEFLARSAVTMKPRHAVWLQDAVLAEAYFSKQLAWSYEQEYRLMVPKNHIENVHGNMILFVPTDCVTSIIVGSRAADGDKSASKELAGKSGLSWYEALVGKSNALPFFLDGDKDVFIFDGTDIVEAENVCAACSEPVDEDNELCAWCRITEGHEQAAAMANPFRMLAGAGILGEYLEGVDRIKRGRK